MVNSAPVADDATSNRVGHLSARQRQALVSQARSLGCLCVFMMGIFVFVVWRLARDLAFLRVGLLALSFAVVWGSWTLISGGLAAYAANKLMKTSLDLWEGRVEQGRGAVAWHRGDYRAQMQ